METKIPFSNKAVATRQWKLPVLSQTVRTSSLLLRGSETSSDIPFLVC